MFKIKRWSWPYQSLQSLESVAVEILNIGKGRATKSDKFFPTFKVYLNPITLIVEHRWDVLLCFAIELELSAESSLLITKYSDPYLHHSFGDMNNICALHVSSFAKFITLTFEIVRSDLSTPMLLGLYLQFSDTALLGLPVEFCYRSLSHSVVKNDHFPEFAGKWCADIMFERIQSLLRTFQNIFLNDSEVHLKVNHLYWVFLIQIHVFFG